MSSLSKSFSLSQQNLKWKVDSVIKKIGVLHIPLVGVVKKQLQAMQLQLISSSRLASNIREQINDSQEQVVLYGLQEEASEDFQKQLAEGLQERSLGTLQRKLLNTSQEGSEALQKKELFVIQRQLDSLWGGICASRTQIESTIQLVDVLCGLLSGQRKEFVDDWQEELKVFREQQLENDLQLDNLQKRLIDSQGKKIDALLIDAVVEELELLQTRLANGSQLAASWLRKLNPVEKNLQLQLYIIEKDFQNALEASEEQAGLLNKVYKEGDSVDLLI